MKFINFKSLSLLIFLLSSGFVFAQQPVSFTDSLFDPNSGLPIGITEQISVEVLPKIPNPGERVRISVESFSSNLDAAYFTWFVDGVVEAEGNGIKNFNFFAPPSGQSTTINLNIRKEDGGTLTRTFTFAPADVDIIYEADTYTHPFYKGKSLFTSQSGIRFIAMPNFVQNGVTINPDNLIYKWKINGTVLESDSGYGRRVLEGEGALIQRPMNVELEVSSPNSDLQAKNSINVSVENPETVVYENNPLLGIIFEKAVEGTFALQRPEVSLQAIPYFFDTEQKDFSPVTYRWSMNGEVLDANQQNSFVTFRNDTGEEGRAVISLDTSHLNNFLQLAQERLTIDFQATNPTTNNEQIDF